MASSSRFDLAPEWARCEVSPMSPNSEYVWPCCNLVNSAMGKATDDASALSNFHVGTKALDDTRVVE